MGGAEPGEAAGNCRTVDEWSRHRETSTISTAEALKRKALRPTKFTFIIDNSAEPEVFEAAYIIETAYKGMAKMSIGG